MTFSYPRNQRVPQSCLPVKHEGSQATRNVGHDLRPCFQLTLVKGTYGFVSRAQPHKLVQLVLLMHHKHLSALRGMAGPASLALAKRKQESRLGRNRRCGRPSGTEGPPVERLEYGYLWFSAVYFSRGTRPTKKGVQKGHGT